MSAITKLSQRDKDFYPTPSWATEMLMSYVPIYGSVFEPCVGQGDISSELAKHDSIKQITTNDIDESVKAHYYLDATNEHHWRNTFRDLSEVNNNFVVTNPPFNKASEIIPLAFKYSKIGIAMLLRGSYTEPTFDRQDWLKEHEENLAHIIYLPRISFTGDGKSDSVSTNWYVWLKEKQNGCKMHWVLKEKRSRRNKDTRLLDFMRSKDEK